MVGDHAPFRRSRPGAPGAEWYPFGPQKRPSGTTIGRLEGWAGRRGRGTGAGRQPVPRGAAGQRTWRSASRDAGERSETVGRAYCSSMSMSMRFQPKSLASIDHAPGPSNARAVQWPPRADTLKTVYAQAGRAYLAASEAPKRVMGSSPFGGFSWTRWPAVYVDSRDRGQLRQLRNLRKKTLWHSVVRPRTECGMRINQVGPAACAEREW